MLNDTYINEGLQLLLSYLQCEHTEGCAIFSTYTMTYVKKDADDTVLWCDVCHCAYWAQAIWIIPTHLEHPYLHCVTTQLREVEVHELKPKYKVKCYERTTYEFYYLSRTGVTMCYTKVYHSKTYE